MKKIILVANAGFTLSNFRFELIQKLKSLNFEVVLLCPLDNHLDTDFKTKLQKLNVTHYLIPLSRKGVNPFKDLGLLLNLLRIFKKEKPNFVFNYTIKPVIYSSLAAKLAGVKSINSFITGLGYVFINQSLKGRILRLAVNFLYRISLRTNSNVFFQNRDDLNLFIESRLVKKEQTFITNGSGVNLEKFFPQASDKTPKSFIFIGRLLKDKGIFELIEAFKEVKKEDPNYNFYICGSLDESNPAALSQSQLNKLLDTGLFEYIEYTNDIPRLLKDKQVLVLPSYREGTPRSVLEAMAMGMPIITTDAPGCRETVVENKNGFLVPIKNVSLLTCRIKELGENKELMARMGRESLQIAQKKYDVQKVNKTILERIEII